jgi:hypothetical protein
MINDDLLKEFEEHHWIKFLEYYQSIYDFQQDDIKGLLDDLKIPKDIKIVTIGYLKKHAKEWLYAEIPAIENQRPIDLLNSHNGTTALKAALIRLPS